MTRLVLIVLLVASVVSCASTTLNPEERDPLSGQAKHEWRPAELSDVSGLYASKNITGPIAAAIWKLYYHFDESGSYTGAALFAEDPPRFEVLHGTWVFVKGRLVLDGGEAAETYAAPNALLLSGDGGTVVLLRENEI